MVANRKKVIWIDMDNSPHVVFFKPIIEVLKSKGYHVVITVRDCFQTCGLADLHDLHYKRVGRHYGKNKLLKVIGLIVRTCKMIPFALKERPIVTLSHGSRSQLFLSNILRIKSIVTFDYEFAKSLCITTPTWSIVPEIVSYKPGSSKRSSFYNYPGIKEDVYVPTFKPDDSIKKDLSISNNSIIVTIRPPATEAHYHNPQSDVLFEAAINMLAKKAACSMIILPRNKKQEQYIRNKWPELCKENRIIIPDQVVDGLNLIWHSDFVISGGGTMNREAAALNVPVYSIFRGIIGKVDRYLEKNNRLVLIESTEDVKTKIRLKKRDPRAKFNKKYNNTLNSIVNTICTLTESI